MLQVFESHGEVLSYDTFMLCSLPYLKQIVEKVKEQLGPNAVPMVRIPIVQWRQNFGYSSCLLSGIISSKRLSFFT